MNKISKYIFYLKTLKQVRERIESMKLNIELYTNFISEYNKSNKVTQISLKKQNKKATPEFKLGKHEISQLSAKVSEWSVAIESNERLIELIEQKMKITLQLKLFKR